MQLAYKDRIFTLKRDWYLENQYTVFVGMLPLGRLCVHKDQTATSYYGVNTYFHGKDSRDAIIKLYEWYKENISINS